MKMPSLTTILSIGFLGYVAYSLYGLYELFLPPRCSTKEKCVKYFLHNEPEMKLVVFASSQRSPSTLSDIVNVVKFEPFSYKEPFEHSMSVLVPQKTRNNGTLFFHVFLVPVSSRAQSWNELLGEQEAQFLTIPMSRYALPASASVRLLNGERSSSSVSPVTHINTQPAIRILTGVEKFPTRHVPGEFYMILKFSSNKKVLPIIWPDSFNTRLHHFHELGDNRTMHLNFMYSPISIGTFRFMVHTEIALQTIKQYGFSDKDIDEVKSIYAATNFVLLGLTIFILAVHLLFDFLALKNDLSFWRNRDTFAGLSLRALAWRSFSQTVVLLYLIDQDTSLLIIVPSAIETLIEFWKIQKVIPFDWRRFKFLPVTLSKEEELTRQMDAEGMRYLSYLLWPLSIGGAVYSLVYLEHRSWYSWILQSLVNGVYAFGFLFMLPQLFINYKLKSVAHMPWKAFMYKAFNTFIDDVFAFLIHMPTSHRLACFRDDVVFIIYLYQRWLYPVDKSRVEHPELEDQTKKEQ